MELVISVILAIIVIIVRVSANQKNKGGATHFIIDLVLLLGFFVLCVAGIAIIANIPTDRIWGNEGFDRIKDAIIGVGLLIAGVGLGLMKILHKRSDTKIIIQDIMYRIDDMEKRIQNTYDDDDTLELWQRRYDVIATMVINSGMNKRLTDMHSCISGYVSWVKSILRSLLVFVDYMPQTTQTKGSYTNNNFCELYTILRPLLVFVAYIPQTTLTEGSYTFNRFCVLYTIYKKAITDGENNEST